VKVDRVSGLRLFGDISTKLIRRAITVAAMNSAGLF